MKLQWMLALMLAAAGAFLCQSGLTAGDKKGDKKPAKDVTINADLTNADVKDKVRMDMFCKTYKYKMAEGRTYQIDMRSTDMDSYLRLEDPAGDQVAEDDDGGGFPNARIVYKAGKNGDFTVVCTTFAPGATGKFTLTIKDITGREPDPVGKDKKIEEPKKDPAIKAQDLKVGKDGAAKVNSELTKDDPVYQGRKIAKVFAYPMKEGTVYRIDHSIPTGDAFLFLEDPTGKIVAANDDNGESLDSRIVYKALQTGNYRVVATSLSGKDTGGFTLTIRPASEDESKQALFQEKLQKMFFASPDERRATAQEGLKMLQAKGAKTNFGDLRMAMQLCMMLSQDKDTKAAGETIGQFGKILTKSDDAKVAEEAGVLEGVARRLNLMGKTMELKGKTLDGKDYDLAKYKGKVILVDFWATWCGPCVAEMPHVKNLYEKYHKQGFEVIGVSIDAAGSEVVQKFIDDRKLPWPCIHDNAADRKDRLSQRYGVLFIPLPILIDREGRVVSMTARGPELTRLLEQMFEEKK